MKKLLLAVLLAVVSLGMSAKDFTVYQAGALADGLNVYGWWNNATDFKAANPSGDGLVMSFKAADGGAAASFGLHSPADSGVTGPLHSATLTFKWYATTAGQTYTVRVTSTVEENYSFTTTAENIGKWNETSLPVATTYPQVAAGWKEFSKAGDGYVFSLIVDGGAPESVLYVDDVIYKNVDETWTKPVVEALPVPVSVPTPAHDANAVISVFSNGYTDACTFGIGGWGQSTQISDFSVDGKTVKHVKFFNYLGWELNPRLDVTSCNMMHVDFFAANEGKFGFTPISPGNEKPWIAPEVKVGEWNSYDVPLSHWDNVVLSDVFQIKFDQGNGNQEGYLANVYFYNNGETPDVPVGPTYELPASWYGSASVDTKNENMAAPVHLDFDYVLTANADKTLTATVTAYGDYKSLPAFTTFQINILGDESEWGPGLKPDEDGTFSRTTTATFEPGKELTPFIWIPYELKGERVNMYDAPYIFGSANEAPKSEPKLKLTAAVDEVGTDSAVISYNVKASNHFDGKEVKVLLDGKAISESPYTLAGLDELTSYTVTLKAEGEVDGVKYESDAVELTFKTKSSTAVAKTWYSINDGLAKNAFLVGETAEMRREIPVSIESEVTYNTDGTITVVSTPHCVGEIVGLVPKLTVSSGEYKSEYQVMSVADGKWSYTTETVYPEEHGIGWLFYQLAYDGGDRVINVNGYTTGLENDKPAYGAPAALDLNLSKTGFAVGETTLVSAIVKDPEGHYLLDTPATFALDGDSFELNGAQLKAAGKGKATLTANCGELKAEKTVVCHTSSAATRIEHEALTGDHDALHLAFDGNEGTEVVWSCAETENHNLTVDLGKKMHIEVITLVWEGASATHYTVKLHNEAPVAPASVDTRADAKDGHVYTVENGEGGAGVTARKELYQDDFSPVAARYVSLETTKAFNAGWGIKLKEMTITGTAADGPTTVIEETVNLSDAPVEVYTFAGVKVADSVDNLPAGLYIVRQGCVSYKVAVK